jgi:general secretion pathway protein A
MYQAHFGLKKSLFEGGIAQEESVYLGPRQQLVAANFKVALSTLDSVILMTGLAGVGKTTLTAASLRATTTRLALGWLTSTPANAHELLELLLTEFGFNAHRVGRVERLQMWRQFLNESAATNSRVFVIAECAEELPQEFLRALDALTASDASGSPGANLVLLGHAVLEEHLRAPFLDSLRQRIRFRQRLEPFNVEELREYLKHRVRVAGGEFDRVFAPDAVTALHDLTGGVLRVVNNLCETALTIAATRREPRLTAGLLQRVATNVLGLDSRNPPPDAVRSGPVGGAMRAAAPALAAETESRGGSAAQPPATTGAPSATSNMPPLAEPVAAAVAPSAPAAATPPAAPAAAAVAPPAPAPATPVAAALTRQTAPAPEARPLSAQRTPAKVSSAIAPPPQSPQPAAPPAPALQPAAPSPAPAAVAAFAPPVAEPVWASVGITDDAATHPDLEGIDDDFAIDTITDLPDVPMTDFPVLTDAVEDVSREAQLIERALAEPAPIKAPQPATRPPNAGPAAKQPPGAPREAASAASPAATRAGPAQTAAPRPAATPPAPAPQKPAAAAPPAPPPQPAAARTSAELAKEEPAEDDVLRETQTMRALASAKSIDDISDSMAETLFGDADLDMLSAALASAGWSEDEPKPADTPAVPETEPADDELDIFGFHTPKKLELMDDDTSATGQRKLATRR